MEVFKAVSLGRWKRKRRKSKTCILEELIKGGIEEATFLTGGRGRECES